MSFSYAWQNTVHDERMARFVKAGLYLVTSQSLSAGRSTPDVVAAALRGGVRLVQLREKGLSARELTELARRVRQQTNEAGALLIINDRMDVAMAVGADGVHLGQDDLPIADARKMAADMIIGASSHDEAEAVAAEAAGASYVNIGPIFPTRTKEWSSEFLGVDGLRRIAPVLNVPFTVMGGIKGHHVEDLCNAGASTLAVVTAVTAAEAPERAGQDLIRLIRHHRGTKL